MEVAVRIVPQKNTSMLMMKKSANSAVLLHTAVAVRMDQIENTGTGMALINVSGADRPQLEVAALIALQKNTKNSIFRT